MVSKGVSARQRPVSMLHLPLAQSRSLRQPWPTGQRFSQVVPPQSTLVSVPSATAATARGPCLSRRRRRRP